MQDCIAGIIWIAASIGIVCAGVFVSRRSFSRDSTSQHVLHTAVLSIGAVIAGLTLPGALGLLTPTTAVLCPLLAAFLMSRFTRFEDSRLNAAANEPTLAWLFWGAVACVVAGHSIVNGILRFPTDWDTLMYHQPFIDHWLQTGTLAATNSPRWSNSANSELLGLWLAAPFSGDFLVPLNNLPVVVVWVAAVLELGRLLGLGGWWRHLAAILCIAVHTTMHETDDASNDLMVPAFFLACLVYSIRFRRSQRSSDLLLVGLCLGVLAGTKFFATGYGFVAGLLFATICFQRAGLTRAIRHSVTVVVVSLLFGGYWYVRNWWLTGAVFYPSGTADLHLRIPHPNLTATTILGNGDPKVPELLLDAVWRLCGPLHYAAVMILPSLAVWLLWTSFRGRASGRNNARLLLFLLLTTCGLALATPMLVEDQPETLNHLRWGYTPIRYSLTFLCVLIVAAVKMLALAVRSVPRRVEVSLLASLMAASFMQLLYRYWYRHEDQLVEILMAGSAAVVALAVWYAAQGASKLRWFAHAVAVCVICGLIHVTSQRWHEGFAEHYDEFYTSDYFQHRSGQGERILVLDERSYACFGSRRQHYIFQPMRYDDVAATRKLMEQHQLAEVVTRIEKHKILARYRPSWEELDANPGFELVAAGHQLRVFRVHGKSVSDPGG